MCRMGREPAQTGNQMDPNAQCRVNWQVGGGRRRERVVPVKREVWGCAEPTRKCEGQVKVHGSKVWCVW